MNELQHYGVKGMRWKHKRGTAKRVSAKTSNGVSTSAQTAYTPGSPVPGHPDHVYYDTEGRVGLKSDYAWYVEQQKKIRHIRTKRL